MELDNLKNKFNAIPKITKAVTKYISGDKASPEVQKQRESACKSCVLFDGSRCNPNKVARVSEKGAELFVDYQNALKNNNTHKVDDIIRGVYIKNKLFVKGCGCKVTGSGAKWKFSFDKKELEKKDGTAPCVLNKWK